MSKKKIIIIVILFALLLCGAYFLFRKTDTEPVEEPVEEMMLEYRNDKYNYRFNYIAGWEAREKETLGYFHSLMSNRNLPATHVNWNTYRQGTNVVFSGFSDFTYIEGAREYQIEHHVYPNPHNLSIRQWYDLFVITEALHTQRITEADFIRKSKSIVEGEGKISDEDGIYDPWSPRGEIIKIEQKNVLKVTLPGDYRYNGYQHYILSFNNYFLVFKFGYGGVTTNRDLWKNNNKIIRRIIETINHI